MYNNRALVPNHADYFARWRAQSAHTRRTHRCFVDVAYGHGINETLDIFPAATTNREAPIMIFIHGGYWRSLDKSDHSFIAPGFTAQGFHVVMPNYALCPAVTIPHIVMQMVKALTWIWRHMHRFGGNPKQLIVVGHSAGGHLATTLMNCQWSNYAADLPINLVSRVVSLSGLYDLQPLLHAPFLSNLQLTHQDAIKASPALMPAPTHGQLKALVGGDESSEFIRHNQLIQSAWGTQRVPVCMTEAGLNHFSIVDALAEPGNTIHQMIKM
jgi:arylformamidase